MTDCGLREIASLVCHQFDARSLSVDGIPLPLCARCTGIYTGFLAAAIIQLSRRFAVCRMPSRSVVLASATMLVALATEAGGERFQLWGLSNWNRMSLGFFGGAASGILLLPLCRYFLTYKPTLEIRRPSHDALLLAGLVALVAALRSFPVLQPVLAVSSILGLVGIYLCLNFAVSGAFLGLRNEAPSRKKAIRMISVVLMLSVVEFLLLTLIDVKQQHCRYEKLGTQKPQDSVGRVLCPGACVRHRL